jgi:hypothetical protein
MTTPPPRLASHIWVNALVRRAAAANITATVLAKGDAMAGSIAIVQRMRGGNNAWYAATSDGALLLIGKATLSDTDVSQKVDRLRQTDADAWVVEVECEDIAQFSALLCLS